MFILQKIRLDYRPVERIVLTDEKWLEFVTEQILSNALKYTKNGGEIRICLEEKRGRGVSGDRRIMESVFRQKIFLEYLKKGLPDIMEEQIRSLPGLDCIFAKRSWIRWDIRYGLIQRWEKEPVYIWN